MAGTNPRGVRWLLPEDPDARGGPDHHCQSGRKYGRKHTRSNRCIKQRHMGWCRGCGVLCAVIQGCRFCGYRNQDILSSRPENPTPGAAKQQAKSAKPSEEPEARETTEDVEPVEEGEAKSEPEAKPQTEQQSGPAGKDMSKQKPGKPVEAGKAKSESKAKPQTEQQSGSAGTDKSKQKAKGTNKKLRR